MAAEVQADGGGDRRPTRRMGLRIERVNTAEQVFSSPGGRARKTKRSPRQSVQRTATRTVWLKVRAIAGRRVLPSPLAAAHLLFCRAGTISRTGEITGTVA